MLGAWSNLVGQNAGNANCGQLVVRGRPDLSFLARKVGSGPHSSTGCGGVMPQGGPVHTNLENLIIAWIREGANNN